MSDDAGAVLRYAVRGRVIRKYLGQLGLVIAALSVAPLAVSLYYHEFPISVRYGAVIGALFVVCLPLARLPSPRQLQTNEAFVIVALAFVIAPLLMTLPMMAAGLSLSDALFEAISGITTTGLSTVADLSDKPHAFLFSRAWLQWYGGLGIAVFSIALLLQHHVTSRRLIEPVAEEGLVTTTRTHARRIIKIYLLLTIIGISVLWLSSGDGFIAVTHTLAAISTGGFSTYNQSLAAVSPQTGILVTALSFCGAISLPLYYRVYQRGWRELVTDVEFKTLVLLSALVWLTLYYILQGSGQPNAGYHAFMLGLSAQTTTGFSTFTVITLTDPAKLLLIGAMFIGGSIGSTSGGIKILRLLILWRLIKLPLQRAAMPAHAVSETRLGSDKPLETQESIQALILIILFIATIFISWWIFVGYGYDVIDSLFEVVSATGTVGLSTGITGSELPLPLKLVLCLDMLLGRLEIIALLVVVYPSTWFGQRAEGL